jgi:hypothetical protein
VNNSRVWLFRKMDVRMDVRMDSMVDSRISKPKVPLAIKRNHHSIVYDLLDRIDS